MKYTNNRARRVDEKNGVICLVIMFTPGVVVIKMLKMAHFMYFLLMPAKNQRKYLRASEGSYLAFSENTMDCWILSYHYQDINP